VVKRFVSHRFVETLNANGTSATNFERRLCAFAGAREEHVDVDVAACGVFKPSG
jgi:hypothetical protein